MVERKGIHPTHLLFANDVFIFCNGDKKSILNLMKLLEDYQKCSGQIINKQKTKLFIDGASDLRKSQLREMIQMERIAFLYKYLGVILCVGRVKVSTIWPMVELMQRKLATWKASIIKTCEKIIRIFLWSGDGDTRKYIKFSWKNVCTPLKEGGLGIPRLENLNKVFLMKMMWKINNSKEDWDLFFQATYKDKNGQWISKWQLSSVWPGLKWAWETLKEDVRWRSGDGFGVVVRDSECQVVATLSGGIRVASNYLAETYGVIAMELAV
ncbi:uncharacterized protein LOC113360324 [Papaver somniferum]|uniref:uncharacterized protein LOC113360324 n=1 Tax=Papaver somniferum TaxID=3469 RepID=UPI000E6FAB77|nr:uncharacterized protein LOC113360324 [Papaver somniferum]